MEADATFTIASEDELVKILSGSPELDLATSSMSPNARIGDKMTGVVSLAKPDGSPLKPVLIVSREEDQRRLFARFSQLRGDLSPITSWCHLVSPDFADRLDELSIYPDFGGFTASWCGLIVAEAAIMASRPVARLQSSACFGTQSYAIARAAGLWGNIHHSDLLDRYDQARSVFSARTERIQKMRESLSPVWTVLLSAASGIMPNDRVLQGIASLLIAVQAGPKDENLAANLIGRNFFGMLSSAVDIPRIFEIPSNRRLEIFDSLVAELRESSRKSDAAFFTAASFTCGYLATVMAGGQASYSVAESTSEEFPEILAWAYVVGGLGERVTWTSSFEGLGRLVARELERPLHLTEAPTGDIAVEEAKALIDPALPDPLVHLKIKSQRSASVSLYPGVTIVVSQDSSADSRADNRTSAHKTTDDSRNNRQPSNEQLSNSLVLALADALTPILRDRLAPSNANTARSKAGKQKSATSEKDMPLYDRRKK